MKKIKHNNSRQMFLIAGMIALLASILLFSLGPAFDAIGMKTLQFKDISYSLFSAPRLEQSDLPTQVYPELLCTCCDEPLAECGCGLAKDMRAWLKDKVDEGISKEDLLVQSAKKFGMKAIKSDTTKEAIKQELIKQAGRNPPKIDIPVTQHDLGNIKQQPGNITSDFEIKNTGKSDLVIDSLDTSCMCTSATLTYDGKTSPVFGMDMGGNNPTGWQVSIPPGKTATLTVIYDPMFHGIQKTASQDITRFVTIYSNDPADFQTQVRIDLKQVK